MSPSTAATRTPRFLRRPLLAALTALAALAVAAPSSGAPSDDGPLNLSRTAGPVADVVAPVTDAVQPVTDAVAPVTETLRPVTDAVRPVTQVVAPVVEAVAGAGGAAVGGVAPSPQQPPRSGGTSPRGTSSGGQRAAAPAPASSGGRAAQAETGPAPPRERPADRARADRPRVGAPTRLEMQVASERAVPSSRAMTTDVSGRAPRRDASGPPSWLPPAPAIGVIASVLVLLLAAALAALVMVRPPGRRGPLRRQ